MPSREYDDDWVPDDELSKINTEKTLFQIEDQAYAMKIMEESLPVLARRMVYLGINSPDPRVAISAINHVMDRVMGKPAVTQTLKVQTNPAESLHAKMMAEIDAMLAAADQ